MKSALAFAPFVLIGTAVLAQRSEPDSGTRIRPHWVDKRFDVRKVLADFATCSVKRSADGIREFIITPGYDLSRRELGLLSTDCLSEEVVGDTGGALAMTPTVVRFSFADALFAKDLANWPAEVLRSAPPLQQPNVDEAKFAAELARAHRDADRKSVEERLTKARYEVAYYRFGECVVRADPNSSKALLASQIESEGEAAAIAALRPALSGCAKEQNMSFDKADVRGTVALNYVRLAYAIQPPRGAASVR